MKITKKLLTLSAFALSGLMLVSTVNQPALAASASTVERHVMNAWSFNESTDTVIDSFYEDDAKRTLSGDAVDSLFSYGEIDVAQSSSADSGIYKYSSETEKKNGSIVFEMMIDESVDLSHILFAARGLGANDAWSATSVPLTQTIDSDSAYNSSIAKGEWVTVEIKLGSTFSGIKYTGLDTQVTSNIGGFSLYNDNAGNTGKIRIRKVSYLEGDDVTVLDDFKRDSGAPAGAYWGGIGDAGGVFVKRNVTLNNGGTYTYASGAAIGNSNIVLSVKGDFSGTKVALVGADGTVGTYADWSSLKDHEGNALPEALDDYGEVSISVASVSDSEEFAGVSLTSTSAVTINRFYSSDCVSRSPEVLMKGLDVRNASYYNDFNFTFEGTWPTAYETDAPTAVQEHGIFKSVNWHNGADVKVKDGALQLPAVPAGDYGSFFTGLAKDPVAKDYLVMSIKLEDGATLNDFRFQAGSNAVLYQHDAWAEYGIKTGMDTSAANPYYNADTGYTYFVYNLAESGLDKDKINGEFTFYYGHTEGTILISDVFFADALPLELDLENKSVDPAEKTTGDGYMYLGYAAPGSDFFTLTVTAGEGGAKLSNLRIQQEGVTDYLWLKDNALIGVDGEPIADQSLAEGESVTLYIDLAKSGYSVAAGGHFHSFWSLYDESVGETGAFTVTDTGTVNYKRYVHHLLSEAVAVTDMDTNYVCIKSMDYPQGFTGDVLQFAITAESDIENALIGVRIEIGGKLVWFNPGQADHFVDPYDQPVSCDLKEGTNIINIGLANSGINPYDVMKNSITLHGGDGAYTTPVSFTIDEMNLVRTYAPESMEGLTEQDFVKPTITLSTDKTEYTVNDTVTITSSVSDNVTAAEDIVTELTVTYGSGDSLENITVTDNSFTATKAGVYTITLKATDEAGNSDIKTVQVQVNEAATPLPEEPEPTPEEPKKLSTGAIVGIVIGCVLGVGIIGYLVYFLLKKRK